MASYPNFNFEGLTEAQLRLFALRCAERVKHLMTDPRSLKALEVAERYARGEATKKELATAKAAAGRRYVAARKAARRAEFASDDTAAAVKAMEATVAWVAETVAYSDTRSAALAAAAVVSDAVWNVEVAEQHKILEEIRSQNYDTR